MKFFKVLFRFADGKYSNTKGMLGMKVLQAESEEDAKTKFGYADVIAVREVSLDDLMASTING